MFERIENILFYLQVININDLTICLDKRNRLGKIYICQEPILYRCSLQARVFRKYNISSANQSSITRIDIFTESIELNISAQQYPMLIRLIVLAIALRDGTLRNTASGLGLSVNNSDGASCVEDESDIEDGSIVSWAWNLLPNIFPIESMNDEVEQHGHYLHTGIYVNNLNIIFKSQEITGDSIVHSTKKIKYNPILKISLKGIAGSSLSLGQRLFKITGGISFIGIYPLGVCVCGQKHIQSSIFTSSDLPDEHTAFLDNSLKDPNCSLNVGEFTAYDKFSEEPISQSDILEVLIERTPAFAFDIIHHIDIPDDIARSSQFGSDLEYSNLSESYVCQAIIGTFNFKYSSSLLHILKILKEYSDRYDYAPYAETKVPLTLSQLSPPSTEDYDALMSDIPIRQYRIAIIQSTIEMHSDNHDTTQSNDHQEKPLLPHIEMQFKDIKMEMIKPFYENRLVHTVCQLPNPNTKLLDNCYVKCSASCFQLNISLCMSNVKQLNMSVFSATIATKMLLKPDFWQVTSPEKTFVTGTVDQIQITMSKPQAIVLHHLIQSILQEEQLNQSLFESTILRDSQQAALPIIDVCITFLCGTTSIIADIYGCTCTIGNILGTVYIPKSIASCNENNLHKLKSIFLTNEKVTQFSSDIVTATIQLPVNFEESIIRYPPIFMINLNCLNVNVDPMFMNFLNYEAQFKCTPPRDTSVARSPRKSVTTKVSTSKKSGVPVAESVHSSSEPTVNAAIFNRPIKPKNLETTKALNVYNLHNIARCLILQIDIKQCTIFAPDKSCRMLDSNTSRIHYIIQNTPKVNYVVIKFPAVSIKSSHERNSAIDIERKFPILFADSIWYSDKDGFPWNFELSDFSCYTIQSGKKFNFLSPNKTKVTLAVTVRPATKEEIISNESIYDPSFAIHIDTAPIELNLSKNQVSPNISIYYYIF